MKRIILAAITALMAVVSSSIFAQDAAATAAASAASAPTTSGGNAIDAKKTSAQEWIKKGAFVIHYVGSYTDDFKTNVGKAKTYFTRYDRHCNGGPDGADTTYVVDDDGNLVITFTPPMVKLCDVNAWRYIIDTVANVGRSQTQSKGDNSSWSDYGSKVSLK